MNNKVNHIILPLALIGTCSLPRKEGCQNFADTERCGHYNVQLEKARCAFRRVVGTWIKWNMYPIDPLDLSGKWIKWNAELYETDKYCREVLHKFGWSDYIYIYIIISV